MIVVATGLAETDGDTDGEGETVGTAAQMLLVMVFVSSVTDPLRANSWPAMVAPVVAVIEVSAKI